MLSHGTCPDTTARHVQNRPEERKTADRPCWRNPQVNVIRETDFTKLYPRIVLGSSIKTVPDFRYRIGSRAINRTCFAIASLTTVNRQRVLFKLDVTLF